MCPSLGQPALPAVAGVRPINHDRSVPPGSDFTHLMLRVAGVSLLAFAITGSLLVIFWRALLKESDSGPTSRSAVVKLLLLAGSLFVAGIFLFLFGS
jgi:hypothetical protein